MSDNDRCTFKDLCIDACDPTAMAPFWASALGLQAEALDSGAYVLGDGVAEHAVWLMRVAEPRAVKNRIHWDVLGDVSGLVAAGARPVRSRADGVDWDVLIDPEGNEFCVFVAD